MEGNTTKYLSGGFRVRVTKNKVRLRNRQDRKTKETGRPNTREWDEISDWVLEQKKDIYGKTRVIQ